MELIADCILLRMSYVEFKIYMMTLSSAWFLCRYRDQRTVLEGSGMHTGLVGHIHLNEVMMICHPFF